MPSLQRRVPAMRYLVVLATLMSFVSVPSNAGANNACSTAMYKRADASLVSAAVDWVSLMRHQKTFVSCDDGALAEGYSDAVVTRLAHRWDQFDAFVRLSARNPAFRRWAIQHIDASASTDDLMRVVGNAGRFTGNPKAKALCREIARAGRNAVKV